MNKKQQKIVDNTKNVKSVTELKDWVFIETKPPEKIFVIMKKE